jgi:hypothetical protein
VRQFETIGEKIAEDLLKVLETVGKHLNEGSRIAVGDALITTIDEAQINFNLLVRYNMEPTRLVQFLRQVHPNATKLLSADEAELYDRMLSEASQYIVDIAVHLPQFIELSIAEILKRENELIEPVQNILHEVRRIREESQQANPEVVAEVFETEYLRAVVRNLDEVQLFGMDMVKTHRRHRLSVAYVTLAVQEKTTNFDEEDEFTDNVTSAVVPVDKTLVRTKRLLVRGLAGSGKTTLLQWIAVKSASRSFEDPLADWNNTIPFFIRLRDFADKPLPSPEAFPRQLAPAIAGTMPDGWVHRHLKGNRAIVLVDGVDEVPQAQRKQVRVWLKDLINSYPNTRIIVSSRPIAIESDWLISENFEEAELQAMNLPDINAFIDHWHHAVQEELHDDTEKAEVIQLAENLKHIVRKDRPIRSLATNPLLCSMLCALHRIRNRQLPSERIELYRASCEVLLERRDPERGITLPEYPHITNPEKWVLLQDLAYWLRINGWAAVPTDQAQTRIEWKLQNMQRISRSVTGHDVLRFFVERSGLLREPIIGQIDFTHLTFQEYLAAQAALDEGDIGVLVQNAHNDQWREIIILAAGLAGGVKIRGQLLRGLLKRGDEEPKHRHQLHLLAVACLETSVELEPALKTEIEERLAKLGLPATRTDAKAFASAGELAVPYLRLGVGKPVKTASACVRALALIGGESALEALEGFGSDKRYGVADELFLAWDAFDYEAYAKRVLSKRSVGLYLHQVPSFEVFQYLQYLINLPSLQVADCTSVADLSPLGYLTQLNSLILWNCVNISDLSPLAHLTNLTSLELSGCMQVTDIKPLENLTQLTSLALVDCEHVDDLKPLKNLTQLTSLNLRLCHKLCNLNALASLTQLTFLDLSFCEQITDLIPLSSLTQLASIKLRSCKNITDLNPLSSLTNLSSLDLSGCSGIASLRPLKGLPHLKVTPPNY